MAKQATELLPCPFCGNAAEMFAAPDDDRNIISCRLGHAPMRTIEGWNMRTESQTITAQQEVIDALQTALSRLCSKYGRTFDETDETRADEALNLAKKGTQ